MLEEFKRIGRFLFQEGLIDSHGGNMSIRQGDKIFITRQDAMLGDLQDGDIIEVGLQASENDRKASREIPVHRAIYESTEALAVIHAHPPNAIAISITDNKVVPQDSEGLFVFKSAPILRVRDAIGSEEVAKFLPQNFKNGYNTVMVRGHGSFAVAKTLEEAYRNTSVLENSCRINILTRSSGGRPRLPEKKVEPRSSLSLGIGVMGRDQRYRRR